MNTKDKLAMLEETPLPMALGDTVSLFECGMCGTQGELRVCKHHKKAFCKKCLMGFGGSNPKEVKVWAQCTGRLREDCIYEKV